MIAEPFALAGQVGLSTSRLRRIDALMQAFIDRGVIAGGVSLLARKGRIAHVGAHGVMDIADDTAMQTDTLFRLASMTKPVIAVAVLTLLEEGKLLLSEPVSNYLPTFRNLRVQTPNSTPPGWAFTDLTAGDFHLVPAEREITIKDLLTHTSGLASATTGPCAAETMALAGSIRGGEALADVIPKLGSVPLSFQPGTRWEYSPGFGFDTLGRIVEIVSGIELDRYLQDHIFDPLEMSDTTFSVPEDKLSRLATVYERATAGAVHAAMSSDDVAHDNDAVHGTAGLQAATPIRFLSLSSDPDNRYYSGGGGLVGTAEDYARFAIMLCSGGESTRGERVLGRKTVELMASNHIGQLPIVLGAGDYRGYRFGLGVRVLDNPAEAATLASPGTFGWSGAFGTNSFIDPEEQLVGVLLIQRQPDQTDHVLRSLWPRYQMTCYQALDD